MKNKKLAYSIFISIVAVLTMLACIAACVRFTAFDKYEVEGSSMFPTLHGKTKENKTNFDKLYVATSNLAKKKITYGDIAVLKKDKDSKKSIDIVKRVIGLPGDVIELKDGNVYRNGKLLNEPYLKPGTKTYPDSPIGNTIFHVGKDEVFMLGDNRSNSLDSRSMGCFSKKQIVGKCISVVRGSKTFKPSQLPLHP